MLRYFFVTSIRVAIFCGRKFAAALQLFTRRPEAERVSEGLAPHSCHRATETIRDRLPVTAASLFPRCSFRVELNLRDRPGNERGAPSGINVVRDM